MIAFSMLMKKWKGWKNTMVNKDLDPTLMREMFNAIRSAEIKNIKTQKNDDKHMVSAITEYITKKVGKECTDEDKKH